MKVIVVDKPRGLAPALAELRNSMQVAFLCKHELSAEEVSLENS